MVASEAFPGSLIVQLPCSPGLGTEDELELRHEIQRWMAEFFELRPIGFVDGGDIGSGTMNIFMNVEPTAHKRVLKAVLQVLEAMDLAEAAVVAYAPDDETSLIVIWPPGFEGSFSVL